MKPEIGPIRTFLLLICWVGALFFFFKVIPIFDGNPYGRVGLVFSLMLLMLLPGYYIGRGYKKMGEYTRAFLLIGLVFALCFLILPISAIHVNSRIQLGLLFFAMLFVMLVPGYFLSREAMLARAEVMRGRAMRARARKQRQ